jgi:hypothetical protein
MCNAHRFFGTLLKNTCSTDQLTGATGRLPRDVDPILVRSSWSGELALVPLDPALDMLLTPAFCNTNGSGSGSSFGVVSIT